MASRSFLAILIISVCCYDALAFVQQKNSITFRTTSNAQRITKRCFTNKRSMVMYLPPNTPTSQTAPMTAQKMLYTPGNKPKTQTRPNTSPALSNSVLASCDTLPRFSTAHGLLSPETVMRLEEMNSDEKRSDAVAKFLTTYRNQGPMSCLPMLSDPNVLPHLTEAMRDIA